MKTTSVIHKLAAMAKENNKHKPQGQPGSRKRKQREREKLGDKSQKVLRIKNF